MSDSPAIVEKRTAFQAKQKDLKDAFELARDGSGYDFSRKSVLEKLGATDQAHALEIVKARNVELDIMGGELRVAELKAVESSIGEREHERSVPVRGGQLVHPASANEAKSFGQLFVESKAFASWRRNPGESPGASAEVDIGLKTLFETGAGFAPESLRTGRLVEAATRPIDVLDLIPTSPINSPVEKYMLETTRTHASAEKAEGIAYAESTFVWTEQTSNVRKITDSIPVTDEQLEDESQIAGLLDQRLRFGLRQRLDSQVLVGDGTAPNLQGFLDAGFITQTQAKGADPTMDAIYKGMTLVRYTGRANPTAVIMHPNDWQDVRLLRTASGDYIFGSPSTPGAQTLWGLPVALSTAVTEGNAIVGDFANFCRIGEKRGVLVEVGYSGTQFVEGKRTIRASLRACFTVYRINAFCIVTGV